MRGDWRWAHADRGGAERPIILVACCAPGSAWCAAGHAVSRGRAARRSAECERPARLAAGTPMASIPTGFGTDLRHGRDWRFALPLMAVVAATWLLVRVLPFGSVELPLITYLPIHTAFETVSLILATLAFGLLVTVPRQRLGIGIVAFAAALLGAAWLDFMHMLSYEGMPPVVTPSGPEKAIQFWLAGRAWMAVGVAAVALRLADDRPIRTSPWNWHLASLAGAGVFTALVLLRPQSLPRTFVPGIGLTTAKVVSELALIGVLGIAAWWLQRMARQRPGAASLSAGAAVAACGELCFASYGSVSDALNLLGHVCKIVAYVCFVRAAWQVSVRQPLEAIGGLAEALQATVNPTLLCDAEGRIRWLNSAAQVATGYRLQELLGQPVSCLSADPALCEQRQTLAAMRDERSWHGQVQVRRRDGTLFHDDRSVTPIRDQQGELTGFVIVGEDVTERERAAREVAETAERLRVLLQSAPDALVVIDERGIIQLANPQVERLFGYRAEQILGRNVSLLMPPDASARHDGFLDAYQRTGHGNIIGTGRDVLAQRADGSTVHVHLTVGEARLPSGNVYIGFMRDITERIEAQQALQEREARYRALMDTALDGVWITDAEGRFVAVNDAYVRMSGYARSELLQMAIADIEASEDPTQVREHIRKAIDEGFDQFESWHRRRDGSRWPVEITATYWPLGSGQFFVFVRDLTRRKADEAALRRSEERFELALRGANDGLWDRDLVTDEVYYSPRWKEMLGYADAELPSSNGMLAGLLHPDDALRVRLALDDAAAGRGGERIELEMRLRHRNGHWVHVLSRAQRVRDGAGRPVRLIGTQQDLTERLQAEHALRQSEDKLRKLFELSPLGIALNTADGTLVDFNEAYRAITGYPAEQLRRMSYWDLTPLEYMAREAEQLEAVARTGRYGPYEKEYRRSDGSLVPVRLNGVQLEVDGRPHLWSIVEDLTVSRQIEHERQAILQQQMQSQKLEALGHLTGGIAHDFNNMLAGIMGLASLGLEKHVDDPDGRLARYLREIVRTSERGRDLVAKMLSYARTEEPEIVQPRDIGPLVEEMRDMLETSIPSSVRLGCHVQPGLPHVRISAVDVHQVVMNLVINARDAIGGHGVVDIDVHAAELQGEACANCFVPASGPHVVLEVRDNGSGIPPEVLPKIFDPFFTTKSIGKGSGLGLPSVLGIVHQAGGHLQVDTGPGRGTTMRVLLPATAPVAVAPAAAAAAAPAPAGASVWVVDDDPAVLVFLTEFLQAHGFHARSFSDPLAVLRAADEAEAPPAVLITDQTMPDLSGAELATTLRRRHPHVAVILCTGFSESIDEAAAQALGIGGYLRKPFESGRLLQVLSDVLACRAS